MRLLLKRINNAQHWLEVDPGSSTAALRAAARAATGWNVVKMICAGQELASNAAVGDAPLRDGALVICLLGKAGGGKKRPFAQGSSVTAAAPPPTVDGGAGGGAALRRALQAQPELLARLELPADAMRETPAAGAVLAEVAAKAACKLLIATHWTAAPMARPLLATLRARVPWMVTVVSAVQVLLSDDPHLVVAPAHALLEAVRWPTLDETQRTNWNGLLLAFCGAGYTDEQRGRLLQRVLLGSPSTAAGGVHIALSLVRAYLTHGHISALLTALETDNFAGPLCVIRSAVGDNGGVAGYPNLLRLLMLGYQHSPALHLVTGGTPARPPLTATLSLLLRYASTHSNIYDQLVDSRLIDACVCLALSFWVAGQQACWSKA